MFLFIIHIFGFFLPSQQNILFLKMKMTQSFVSENVISENTCEAFMNDVMEEECLQECEINLGLQTKIIKNSKSKK